MIKLRVDDLRLSYGALEILKGVSVTLNRGEVVVLLGPSGSGKTTLLRAIAGLESPATGKIRIDDKVMYDGAAGLEVPAEHRNLGLVFQSYALWPHRTVFDNVAYGLRLRKVPGAEIDKRTRAALAELGLDHLSQRFPHQLSGGQQQRVAIARALVYNPPVILLDEPLSNLDAKLREEAKAWLKGLIVELNLSAIVVTHDQSEAMAMADKVILLREGEVVQEGPPEQIYNHPNNLFTAEFFGQNNRLDGMVEKVANGTAIIAGAGWSATGTAREDMMPGDRATGVIRIERMRIAEGPGEYCFPVRLVTSMFIGDRWQHIVRLGDHVLRVHGRARLSGEDHWLGLPADDLWIFKADPDAKARRES